MRRRLILASALLLAVTPAVAQTAAPPETPVAVAPEAQKGGSGGNPGVWILVGMAVGLLLIVAALKGDGGAAFMPPA
jgi:hypothetical protein